MDGAATVRPTGHAPWRRSLVPELGPEFAQPGDLVELYRSEFGLILAACNVSSGRVVIARGTRIGVYLAAAAVPPLAVGGLAGSLLTIGLSVLCALVLWGEAWSAKSKAARLARVPLKRFMMERDWRQAAPDLHRLSALPGGYEDVEDQLRAAFVNDAHFAGEPLESSIRVLDAGVLKIPSGRLVAVDPFTVGHPEPIAVPPGIWPVQVALVENEYEALVGFARVRFSNKEPASYRRAGHGRRAWDEPGNSGLDVSVDGGVAAFADHDALAGLSSRIEPGGSWGELVDARMRRRWRTQGHGWFAQLDTSAAKGNLVLFQSGDGDGTYPAYYELDESGGIIGVVLDFGLGRSNDMNVAAQRDEAARTEA